MTTIDLLELHKRLCGEAIVLMARKNHDYAGSTGDTPFANFELCEQMGLCDTLVGVLVRMTDKLRRMATFAKTGNLENESVHDTVLDLINYSVIVAGLVAQRNRCWPVPKPGPVLTLPESPPPTFDGGRVAQNPLRPVAGKKES